MKDALATLASAAALALAGCTGVADPAVTVPADLARPPCRPAAELMATPGPLQPLVAGERMVEAGARDTLAYNALRRAMIDLQKHVRERCQ
jgi:hypothetical protein